MTVVIANIVSLLGCTLMVLIGFIKNKDKILKAQILQFGLMGLSNFILGGYGGAVANFLSIFRNIYIAKRPCTKTAKIVFILLQVALSVTTVSLNPITWFPIINTVLFTWYIDTKNIVWFKSIIIFTLVLWGIYDICHLNFVSAAFDVFTIVSTAYSVLQIRKERKAEEN